jgi:serine/threonine-protein phosphatase 2B catalytic subunit
MLRGNHECRSITEHFSFRDEVITKYDEETYDLVMDLFDTLPIAGLVGEKYFAVHGGIGPDLKNINNIDT